MIKRLFHTLRPLKWEQYWYRAINPVRRFFYRRPEVPMTALNSASSITQADLFKLPVFDVYHPEDNSFELLNVSVVYGTAINWNDISHGMLWAYHLNYFNWLEDDNISVADRRKLIDDYSAQTNLSIGKHAYPTSLRCVNWIRFMVREGIQDLWINTHIYQHYHRLYSFPEYHLQGNHLWENGCSLLMGGQFFEERFLYERGKVILLKALQEQISSDGGHVEGSPVYHSLLLLRLLQYLEFIKYNNRFPDRDFEQLVANKVCLMLSWLKAVTFSDGSLPMVNDSAYHIAPDPSILEKFAAELNIKPQKILLSDSGYRMWRIDNAELFIDVANITPKWQPGHSHADTFSFCLSVNGKPHIIDPGISTYENNERRRWERSTNAHNTITINQHNSSDVWKSFRIGKRASVTIINDTECLLKASHNGYRHFGIRHSRTFSFKEHKIIIEDELIGLKAQQAVFYLHFHKDIILNNIDNFKFLAGNLLLEIEGAKNVYTEPYIYADGFNKTCSSIRLCISVPAASKLTIEILHAD